MRAIGFYILKTMTIRFLNPKKLGAAVESWLRHDVFGLEWTAATCLYLFSSICVCLPLACMRSSDETSSFRSECFSGGVSLLVEMAVRIVVLMVPIVELPRSFERYGAFAAALFKTPVK